MTNKVSAWSYSRWALYEECPAKFRYKHIDRLPEEQGPALARGDEIHKKLEHYLTKGGSLPHEAKLIAQDCKVLRGANPQVELSLAFNRTWEPTQWFSKEAWCRVKIDVLIPPVIGKNEVVKIVDFKTGKLKDRGAYGEQLMLYGLAGLLAYPIAEKADAELLFVDHGVAIPAEESFHRKDEPSLKKKWELMVRPMLSDTAYRPKPGIRCKWCSYSKDKGGPCEH